MIFKFKKIIILIAFLILSLIFVINIKLMRLAEDRINLLRSLSFSLAYSENKIGSFDDLKEESYVVKNLDINSEYLPFLPHPEIIIFYKGDNVFVQESFSYPVSIFRMEKLSRGERWIFASGGE